MINFKYFKFIFTNLFALLFSLNAISQWYQSSGGNKFDGAYRSASVVGKGGEWPYKNPRLIINKFKEEEPNIYLTGIGYTGCSDSELMFAFDGVDEILKFGSSSNSDKDAAFVSCYLDSDYISLNKLIEFLKIKSKVYVRYESKCGKTDLTFGLSGSGKAIDYVIGDYYDKKMVEIADREKMRLEREREQVMLRQKREERKRIEEEKKRMEEQEKRREEMINYKKESIHLIEVQEFEKIRNFTSQQKLIYLKNKYSQNLSDQERITAEFKTKFNSREEIVLYNIVPVLESAKLNYCFKVYAASSGSILENRIDNFHRFRKYEVINKSKEGCIMVKCFDSREELEFIYYLSKESLLEMSQDLKTYCLVANWDGVIN